MIRKNISFRRYKLNTILEIISKHQSLTIKETKPTKTKYIGIPRYNAIIKLNSNSICFFFQYIYKVRTIRTYIVWIFLIIISFSKILQKLINKSKSPYTIFSLDLKNIENEYVNVIYIEWHFLGLFSSKSNTVTHILTNEKYKNRLKNEIEARNICLKNKLPYIPKLIDFDDNSFWTEEIAVGKNSQFISDAEFISAQDILLKIYSSTKKSQSLKSYLENIRNILGSISNDEFKSRYEKLSNFIISNSNWNTITIDLCLVHGDFNKGQILKKENNFYIIDWSDSGIFNILYDLITITLNASKNNVFSLKLVPKEYTKLKNQLIKGLNHDYIDIYIALTLLESLTVQFEEFSIGRGPIKRWIDQVDTFLANKLN